MKRTIDYLREYIDDNATYSHYNAEAKKRLSIQLAGNFKFYKIEILGEVALFLKPADKYTVDKLHTWMNVIEDKIGIPTVIIMDELTPYMTKKMLMEHVAFVVPGKQINLPFLALHVQSVKKRTAKNIRKFAPATQLIYLYMLYEEKQDWELGEITEKLKVSPMTAVRGMNDLTELGLVTFDVGGQTGRKKFFHRIEQKQYYSIGKKYIDNPVKDVVYVSKVPNQITLVKADLSALAEQTMLGEPLQDIFALYVRDRSMIEDYIIERERAEEEQCPMIQIYKYDVKMIAEHGCVDPISLIAGLAENDERIEMCIEKLMENREWYEA